MKITDYVTLLKAGMTLDEIREREAAEAEEPAPTEPAPTEPTEPAPSPEPTPAEPAPTEPEPDYKALYEAQAKTLEEKDKALKDLQKQNTQANIQPEGQNVSAEDILNEAMRSFM